jgi:hypothetical protein
VWAGFIPDCVILFKRLLGDPMVPRGSKFWLGGLILYLAMPIDLVPDFVPIAGQLDDAIIVALVLRLVLRWPGEVPSGSIGPTLSRRVAAGGVVCCAAARPLVSLLGRTEHTSLGANSSIMLRGYSSIVSILSPWMPAMRSRRRGRVSGARRVRAVIFCEGLRGCVSTMVRWSATHARRANGESLSSVALS